MGLHVARKRSTNDKQSLGYLILRANKSALKYVQHAFDGHDVSFSQWIALYLVRENLASTVTTLANCLAYAPGATTHLLDRLERSGYVVRTRSGTDRRVVQVSLTKAGVETVMAIWPLIAARWNAMLSGFTRKDIEALIVFF
jgi:DNA-binding MarR family transcriptional regulator